MVEPLRNETRPLKPLHPWVQPQGTFKYKVRTGDSWLTLAARNHHQFADYHLIWINFQLSPLEPYYTNKVNWYLREYVGCRHSHDGGRNWAFTDDADPGFIFLPTLTYDFDAIAITGSRGLGQVNAPQYDDENAYDLLAKALDIYSVTDMGVNMLEIPLPALIEGGMIVTGTLAAIAAPFVALGDPYNAALKYASRGFFFRAFCYTFVMAADGWSAETVASFYPLLEYPPPSSTFPEKAESFRKLYNFGLKAGILQARRLNRVDVRNLFVLLRSQLSTQEALDYTGRVKEWPTWKKKEYYLRLSGILKEIMFKKDLQVTLR
ncbi:MAG TPA: hypothetical protein VKV96_04260 [Roseiarcus sp.]|nr:hypothetical protein [Roseiarcus sp.]